MAQEKETKRIIRLLESTAEIAQDASLTGMLQQGQKASFRQYNAILEYLRETEEIPDVLFPPLEENASFDEIGVACRQLAAYIKEDEPAKAHSRSAPFLEDSPIINIGGDLKDLGKLIRDSLPEWMKKASTGEKPDEQPKESETVEEKEIQDINLNELESQMSELGAQMQVMAERLRRESLSPDEIQRLADGMRELGDKHAELAKKQAALRLKLEANSE
jgi:hypothetical protein